MINLDNTYDIKTNKIENSIAAYGYITYFKLAAQKIMF